MALPLFDEPVAPAPPKVERESAKHGTRLYFVWWNAFRRGADGQAPPGIEHDERTKMLRDGTALPASTVPATASENEKG